MLFILQLGLVNAQSGPTDPFDTSQEITQFELVQFYLDRNEDLETLDSIAKNISQNLYDSNRYRYVLNELVRISFVIRSGDLEKATLEIELISHEPLIQSDDVLNGYFTANIGSCLFAMSKPHEARVYYRKALDHFYNTTDSIGIKANLINVGNTFMMPGGLDSALIYYELAKEMENDGIQAYHFSLKSNLALLSTYLGDTQEAQKIYEDLLFSQHEFLTDSEFSTVSLNLGRSYTNEGKYKEAIAVLVPAVERCNSTLMLRPLPHLMYVLSTAYEGCGQDQMAYHTLLKVDSLNYHIAEQNLDELRAEIEMKNLKQLHARDQEFAAYKLEAQSKRQKELVIAILAVSMLLIWSIFLYLLKIKKNKILVKQNILLTQNTARNGESKSSKNSDIPEELKDEITRHLEENKMFEDPELSLEKLAKKCGSNRTYISEAIKAIYGEPFRSVVNKMRIAKARRLLIDENYRNYSIEGIAQTVGYRNISSFNNAFKRETGLTASYFRKNA